MSISCAQTEDQYLETEARFLTDWHKGKANGSIDKSQMNLDVIPSWLNAPDWALWLMFCSHTGWLFLDKEPRLYGSPGIVSRSDIKVVPANEVEGVLFFRNSPRKLGQQEPFWVQDRRKRRVGEKRD